MLKKGSAIKLHTTDTCQSQGGKKEKYEHASNHLSLREINTDREGYTKLNTQN